MDLNKYLFEFVATFVLVFVVLKSNGDPVSIGIALAAAALLAGSVSGAHVNPAVSFAKFFKGKMDLMDFVSYVLVQLGAAALAAQLA